MEKILRKAASEGVPINQFQNVAFWESRLEGNKHSKAENKTLATNLMRTQGRKALIDVVRDILIKSKNYDETAVLDHLKWAKERNKIPEYKRKCKS